MKKSIVIIVIFLSNYCKAKTNIVSVGIVATTGNSNEKQYNTEITITYQKKIKEDIYLGLTVGSDKVKILQIGKEF
jgi:hypothetical protein